MLRRLTLGFFALACAAAVAACSSGNATIPSSGGVPGEGPNFTKNTIYVSNTTQNAVDIYTPSPAASATPQFQIGGSNTGLNGPSYLTFDPSKRLFVSNYSAATKAASVVVFQTYATGNVLPLGSVPLATGTQPHGIADIPNNGGFVVSFTQPGAFFSNGLYVLTAFTTSTGIRETIAGANTQLNNPIGVAVDAKSNIYTANSGDGKIRVYPLPSPTPTPSTSPSATASPTPTASASASASPSPTPTPISNNIAPSATISCLPAGAVPASCMTRPTGLTLDGSGNVYVTDPDSGATPAVYIFAAAQVACGAPPCTLSLTPSRFIAGSSTGLVDPTDVSVDSSGTIYVVDQGSGPNSSKLLIFPPTANGNVAPSAAIKLPAGTATGMALSP